MLSLTLALQEVQFNKLKIIQTRVDSEMSINYTTC